jgi:MYXO-CTERM domain-containing protein
MGGPVLDHVKVFTVYWGKTVNFSGTGSQGLDSFYTAVVNSSYYDWLNEYKTTTQPMVGRGSFIGSYAYTGGATGSIDDSQIQTALGSLIDSGKLPKPDANTLFAVHFAAGISITQNNQGSCQVFCAYHNSFTHGSGNVYYSVVPDQGGACAGGCGGDPSTFNNTTSVSSHELVEATTDPDVGNNNIAWYNQSQGEIGDICNAQQCSGTSGTGSCPGSWVVQLEWSNKNNACISNDPTVVVNDFSVAASPTSLMVPAGGMATTKLTLTKTAGSADTVKLSANTVTGLTVSFSPTSATSNNGTSTVTIAADATAMLGAMDKVTVTAAGTTSTHTLDIPVTITAPPDMAMPPDLAQPNNGGNGGNGGGGNGGNGGGGNGGNGTGGNGTGGNGNNGGGGSDSGCSMSGGSIAGGWAFAAFVLLALAFRRRRA